MLDQRLLLLLQKHIMHNLLSCICLLDNFNRFVVGRGLKKGESVIKAEVGTGWPTDVPKFRRREDLFK